jgi:hypothetical protein
MIRTNKMVRLALGACFAAMFAIPNLGCTSGITKMIYNTLLPRLVLQRLDKFFDLTHPQEVVLQTQIAGHHSWHRRTQLRLYVQDLQSMATRARRKLKSADLDWLLKRLKTHRDSLFSRIIPDGASLLQSLSAAQITHLEKELRKENKELWLKLSRPPEDRHEAEFWVMIKNIETWTGSLDGVQRDALRAKYNSMPDAAEDWLSYRTEQQHVFIALLKSGADRKTLLADLDARMLHQEEHIPKKFLAGFRRTMVLWRELILTADALLTQKQRSHVLAKIGEYVTLLNELAANPG